MATPTRTQRQATAKKAAATRKRNAAKGGTQRTKASARRTTSSARATGRAARTTAKQAARTGTRRAAAETTRLEGVARQAERAVLIPVGAALEARDRLVETAATYTNRRLTRRELNRFERRGAAALRRNRKAVSRQADGLTSSTEDVIERVRTLV